MLPDAIKKRTDSRPAIAVRNVHKEFIIPHEKKTTLFENILGLFKPSNYEKFVALEDINLTVERGESIGIIGDNGSGKSTLLKIISKILRPTSGSVEVNGKITPFLELGVGFQPDLTARENIEVYSTIMGLSKKEISKNTDHVLEFAGLTRFKDTKLKNFSSGMQVRLAFATAIQTTPDILIVDEVLAVGDMDFQQKCLDVFNEYRKKGITIIFVSHDLSSVRRFCDKTMLLKDGKQIAFGKTVEIIDRYIYGVDKQEAKPVNTESQTATAEMPVSQTSTSISDPGDVSAVRKDRWGNQNVLITSVKFIDKFGSENDRFNSGDPMKIQISYQSKEALEDCVFGIAIYNENDLLCYGSNTEIDKVPAEIISGNGLIELQVDSIPFLNGKYFVTVAAHSKNNITYDWLDKRFTLSVINTSQKIGLVDIKNSWSYIGGKELSK
ncbi:MAG TPA: ABC transporter ATP-binding protein [Methanocella sp.]|nr:ABC transporter ATP-binding protein [Methanocella sp.]